jgi:hypothetical protein
MARDTELCAVWFLRSGSRRIVDMRLKRAMAGFTADRSVAARGLLGHLVAMAVGACALTRESDRTRRIFANRVGSIMTVLAEAFRHNSRTAGDENDDPGNKDQSHAREVCGIFQCASLDQVREQQRVEIVW